MGFLAQKARQAIGSRRFAEIFCSLNLCCGQAFFGFFSVQLWAQVLVWLEFSERMFSVLGTNENVSDKSAGMCMREDPANLRASKQSPHLYCVASIVHSSKALFHICVVLSHRFHLLALFCGKFLTVFSALFWGPVLQVVYSPCVLWPSVSMSLPSWAKLLSTGMELMRWLQWKQGSWYLSLSIFVCDHLEFGIWQMVSVATNLQPYLQCIHIRGVNFYPDWTKNEADEIWSGVWTDLEFHREGKCLQAEQIFSKSIWAH